MLGQITHIDPRWGSSSADDAETLRQKIHLARVRQTAHRAVAPGLEIRGSSRILRGADAITGQDLGGDVGLLRSLVSSGHIVELSAAELECRTWARTGYVALRPIVVNDHRAVLIPGAPVGPDDVGGDAPFSRLILAGTVIPERA